MSEIADDDDIGEQSDDIIQYRGSDEESPSLAVISAVAELHGCEPTELDPLYTTVNPDALDALMSGPSPLMENHRITFEYEGASVKIEGPEQLTIFAKIG